MADPNSDLLSSLLELAANDDAEGLRTSVAIEPSLVHSAARWACRRRASNRLVLLQRTPLMVAATYGSLEVMRLLLSLGADANRASADDGATALHCAAAGGADSSLAAVKILLESGADFDLQDFDGFRPADVVASIPRALDVKIQLVNLLDGLRVSSTSSLSPPLSSSPDGDSSPSSESSESPINKKEYPIDPSLPDIKNSIYSTDEFRMFSFKVRPCSRAYSHDWTECPFVHPGENARRRDPRKFHYSCVPCPDFRKGTCRRGDLCEYAHGVFECWLHPAQYRTRLCKDGVYCARRVCFFAHNQEELRPLFVSTGSAVPSPRSSMDMAASSLMLGSPSAQFTPPMSPSSLHQSWPQPAVPSLRLPENSLSRLRTSVNVRDLPSDGPETKQLLNDHPCFSPRSCPVRFKAVAPANLDQLFEVSSPIHKSAIIQQLQQQQQQQQQSLISSVNMGNGLLLHSSPAFSRTSTQAMVEPVSPMGVRLAPSSPLQREKWFEFQQMRSLSSVEQLGSAGRNSFAGGSPWAGLGLNSRVAGLEEWNAVGEEISDEPDVSWVQSLVRESPQEEKEKQKQMTEGEEQIMLSAWLEKIQIDQGVAP